MRGIRGTEKRPTNAVSVLFYSVRSNRPASFPSIQFSLCVALRVGITKELRQRFTSRNRIPSKEEESSLRSLVLLGTFTLVREIPGTLYLFVTMFILLVTIAAGIRDRRGTGFALSSSMCALSSPPPPPSRLILPDAQHSPFSRLGNKCGALFVCLW